MKSDDAFSLCELLIALGLGAALLGMAAEGVLWVRKVHAFNMAATRDLLRARYFLEVECPEILRTAAETGESPVEIFFVVGSLGRREISKEQFDLGLASAGNATLVWLKCIAWPERNERSPRLFPVRVRFESPSHLKRHQRRGCEVDGVIPLFAQTPEAL